MIYRQRYSDRAALCQSETQNVISSPRELILSSALCQIRGGSTTLKKKKKNQSKGKNEISCSLKTNEFENLSVCIFGIH